MLPEEREELLVSMEHREDEQVARAFRKKMVPVDAVLSNVGIIRRSLDPRVLLEAQDVGCPPDELEQMKARMKRWAGAVVSRPEGESGEQRRVRLRNLMAELHPDDPTGCGCHRTGLRYRRGDITRKHITMRDVVYVEPCSCDLGQAKAEGIKEMGGRRRRGRKPGKGAGLEDVL